MTVDLKIVQNTLCDKLINTGWYNKLRFFTKSSEFEDILLHLANEASEGRRFTPMIKDIFKPFELTKFNELKVVILCKEPRLNPMLNNGLALSHRGSLKQEYDFQALISGIGNCSVIDGDLTGWAKQGVLLLNSSLTTRIDRSGAHKKLWGPFISYLFDVLNRENDLIWLTFGRNDYLDLIDNKNHVKLETLEIPNERKTVWNGLIFHEINKLLTVKGKSEIVW